MSAERTSGPTDDAVLTAITFRRDLPDPRHDLLRAFRAGEAAAAAQVAAAVAALLEAHPAVAPAGTVVVAVPGHRAGAANEPCAALIRALAPSLGWVVAGLGILVRIADAPEGKAFGQRDIAAEAATLAWDATTLAAAATAAGTAAAAPAAARASRAPRILLVDDVVASGATLRAALAALPPEWRVRASLLAAFRSVTG